MATSANRPSYIGNLGTSVPQGVASNFGVAVFPSGSTGVPQANIGFFNQHNTGTPPTITPVTNTATATTPDVTAWSLFIATRASGVEARIRNMTTSGEAATTLVGRTVTPNTSRTIAIGSDFSGTRTNQCDIAAAIVMDPAAGAWSAAQCTTAATFLRALLAPRGITGF